MELGECGQVRIPTAMFLNVFFISHLLTRKMN